MVKNKQFTMKDIKSVNSIESSFETTMVRKIKLLFPDCFEIPKPIRPSTRGTPDRMFVIRGKFVAIETKRPKNSVTAEKQKERVEQINKALGYATIARDWETVEKFLYKIGLLPIPNFGRGKE